MANWLVHFYLSHLNGVYSSSCVLQNSNHTDDIQGILSVSEHRTFCAHCRNVLVLAKGVMKQLPGAEFATALNSAAILPSLS